jgi:hypothetical protein
MLSLCKYKTYKFPLVGASLHHKGETAGLNLSSAHKTAAEGTFPPNRLRLNFSCRPLQRSR